MKLKAILSYEEVLDKEGIVNVIELIIELEKCPNKDMEIGYEVKADQLELLVGKDADDSNARGINIPNPKWN